MLLRLALTPFIQLQMPVILLPILPIAVYPAEFDFSDILEGCVHLGRIIPTITIISIIITTFSRAKESSFLGLRIGAMNLG